MKKVLLAMLAVGSGVAAHATVVFQDGFETGDLSQWTGTTSTEPEDPFVQNTTVHSGSFAAAVPGANVSGTSALDRQYKNLGAIPTSQTITFSFWMKLSAANTGNRQYAELRSYTGDVYNGSVGVDQIFAVGATNLATNLLSSGGTVTSAFNTNKWQFRMAFGLSAPFSGNGGWYQLDQAANRTTNWTKFDIVIAPTGVSVFVDGVNGLAAALPGGRGGSYTIDSLVMGSGLTSASNTGYFDDFSVQAVPEPGTMAALGLGAMAILRRKRK